MENNYFKKRIENVINLYKYHILKEDNIIDNNLLENLEKIDEIISKNLENYTIQRLNLVDLAILEYAVYEIKYLNIKKNIAINEALEISKLLTEIDDYKSSSFNNKVLDNICKYLGL